MNKDFVAQFLKGVASTGIGNLSQVVLGFLGTMIVVRFISKEQFGVFVLLQVSAFFFVALSSFGLECISVTRLIAGAENAQKAKIANTAMCYKILIDITISALILASMPFTSYIFKSEQLSQLVYFIPIVFLSYSFNQLFLSVLQGFHHYKKMAISQVIDSSLKLILILIFLILFKMDLMGLIYAVVLSSTASIIYQYSVLPLKKEIVFDSELYNKIFRFGFPLGLNNMLNFVFTKIDRFIIAATMSALGIAYYEVASKIPESSGSMYDAFRRVYFPTMSELISKGRRGDAEKLLNNSLRLISLVSLFAALGVTVFQKDIIRMLFSEKYLESAPALSLLMVSLSISLVGNVLGTSLVAYGQSDKPVKINVADMGMSVVGNLLMIPIFGFMGAVYAAILSRCATNPLNVFFLKKVRVGVRVSQYIKPFFAFTLCYSVFMLFKPVTIVVRLILIIMFLILCVVLSVIKIDDITFLFKYRAKAVMQMENGRI